MPFPPKGPPRTRWPWRRRVRRPPRRIPRTSVAESVALRAIVAMKAVKSATLCVIGLALLALVRRDLGDLAERVAVALHFDVHRAFLARWIEKLHAVETRQKAFVAAGAIAYSGVLAVEAYGLARRRAWAAWLAVGVGAALLPIEVYELVERPRFRLAVALAINVLVVVYLAIEARRARRNGA